MKTVSCHRKYPITTNFLDTMLEHSVEIQEGESKLDAYRRGLKELDQIAAELRKEVNQQGETGNGISLPKDYVEMQQVGVINLKDIRLKEEIEDRILAAESVDELISIQVKYVVFPVPLNALFKKRMQELTSGRPQNFTDGLE